MIYEIKNLLKILRKEAKTKETKKKREEIIGFGLDVYLISF